MAEKPGADDAPFPRPWMAVGGAAARALERELRAEVHLEHALASRCGTAVAIARREDRDDVAFQIDGGFAVVHLTWKGRAEHGAWPAAELYPSLDALRVRMSRDHENR